MSGVAEGELEKGEEGDREDEILLDAIDNAFHHLATNIQIDGFTCIFH